MPPKKDDNMIRTIVTLMTALAISAAAPKPAHAQERVTTPGYEQSSVTVSYGDLNLSSNAGVDTLMRRMNAAARTVCGWRSSSFATRVAVESCMHTAILDALNEFGSPAANLTAAKNKTIASR